MSLDPAQLSTLVVNAGLGAGILYAFIKYVENMNRVQEALAELKASIERLIATQERFITSVNIILAKKGGDK
jgi:hypothetical protein